MNPLENLQGLLKDTLINQKVGQERSEMALQKNSEIMENLIKAINRLAESIENISHGK